MPDEIKNDEISTTNIEEKEIKDRIEPTAATPETRDNGAPHEYSDKVPFQRMPRFRKKSCRFCHNAELKLEYKNVNLLEKFITDRGKILPRRITGTCSKHQRSLAREIKRARILALLPFVLQ